MSVPWTTALRTSIDAEKTTSRLGRGFAASPFWRSRRRTFSTSMMASSTTSPRAMTRPARTMVLRVPPRHCRTSTAARRESGMARRLMTAVRHSKRKAARMSATRRQPQSMACRRLSRDISMKVAGRKIVESTSMPPRAGRRASRASSTRRVTSRVLPQGCFSTMRRRPGPSLMTASPIGAGCPSTTRATSPMRSAAPPRKATGTVARSSALVMAPVWATASRWLGVSMKPPAPTAVACPAAATSASRDTWCVRRRSGSTRTCSWRSRCPQMATLATPGIAMSRGRTVHFARIVRSIWESVSEDTPIFITRLMDESGESITGERATAGR